MLPARQPLHPLRATDRAWRNDIARNTAGTEFQRSGRGEGIDGGFGGHDVCLERRTRIMQRCGYEDDAAAGGSRGFGVGILARRFYEVGEGRLERVVGAEDVDVDYGLEGVGGEGGEGGKEVSGCAGAVVDVNY